MPWSRSPSTWKRRPRRPRLPRQWTCPIRIYREYNLHIRKYNLPRGVYHLYVPVEKRETFLKGVGSCPDVTLQQRALVCGRPVHGGQE